MHGEERGEATWDYQKAAPFAPEMRALYEQRGIPWMDYPEIVSLIRTKGATGINPLLSPAEQDQLAESVDPSQIVDLVLRGLSKT
jgi:hypothetical protein